MSQIFSNPIYMKMMKYASKSRNDSDPQMRQMTQNNPMMQQMLNNPQLLQPMKYK